MQISKNMIALSLLIAVSACGGAKTASDANHAECDAVAAKLQAVDDSVKNAEGTAVPRSLGPALEKLAQDLKADPITSPQLKTAADDLSAEASKVGASIKELIPVFEEMEKAAAVLDTWQKDVEVAATQYDNVCAKGPKDDCETVNKSISKVPHLDGDKFAAYADELEAFVKAQEKIVPADRAVAAAFTNMYKTLGQAIEPMRKMDKLMIEARKSDEAAKNLKIKANKVREICGLPLK